MLLAVDCRAVSFASFLGFFFGLRSPEAHMYSRYPKYRGVHIGHISHNRIRIKPNCAELRLDCPNLAAPLILFPGFWAGPTGASPIHHLN